MSRLDKPVAPPRAARVLNWTRTSVRELQPYYRTPPHGEPLRLDQNANLWGPNPVLAGLNPAAIDAAHYPTRDADHLLAALARHHRLDADRFVVGNGSDELLDLVTKAFTEPGQVLATPWPGYSLYPFFAALQGLRLVQVPLQRGHRLDVDAIIAARPDIVILASPDNPTGERHAAGEIERLLAAVDGIVVVDEAYIEYAGEQHSLLARVDEFDNLVVTRTFSKAYALAGLRVGYAAGNAALVARLRLVKPPYNVNVLSEAAAVMALDASEWMRGVVAQTTVARALLAETLQDCGFRVYPSAANFLLTDAPVDPGLLVAGLRGHGIAVRAFPGAAGLESAVRFSVGREEHTAALAAALRQVFA